LHTHHLSFSNEEVLKKYPKFQIEIKDAQLHGLWTEGDAWDSEQIGSVINLQVHFENPRPVAVEIQSFKLDNSPNMTRVTLAEKGEIYDLPHLKFSATRLDNLNDCPVHTEKGITFDGWLQFILRGVQPQNLEGAAPMLIIADSSGEKHPVSCPELHRT
ncbi:MAG: hypothetical protein QOC99_2108, partial [Acidobacteriota bacterium]|nr:hypothetical protein [Acidobacteriota bacterium]